MAADKQHAHQLLDQLASGQMDAVVHLLEVITDPLTAALANAPVDDEPFTDAERQAVAEADEWIRHNKPIAHEEVLAELGLTMEDWGKMADEPSSEDSQPKDTQRQNG